MITDWSGLTPLAIAQMSECSICFLSSAQRGPWVCVIPFAGEEGLASQHVLDVVLGNAPPNAILLDFSLREEAVLERPGAMLRMTATLWAGMRWGTPFPGQVVGLCNILTRFPGRFMKHVLSASKMKVQGRTIPKISRTISKISKTISKNSRTNSKVSRNKGLPSAPERKRPWTWTVGRFNLLADGSRSWGPRCRVSSLEIGPATSHSCFPVVAASGLNKICS